MFVYMNIYLFTFVVTAEALSLLGPQLYCMYTKPGGDIVNNHNLLYHCYADDTKYSYQLNMMRTGPVSDQPMKPL